MTLDEFVQRDLETSGKSVYTLADIQRLTEQWIAHKSATAAPFDGWKSDEEVDVLLGIGQKEQPSEGVF